MKTTRALNKIEQAARPDWRREWGEWWQGLKDGVPEVPHAVMDWALEHHCEGGEFDRKAEAAVEEVMPERGDWHALCEWADALYSETTEILEEEDFGRRSTDLPAPPFVPTEDDISALVARADRTPEGVAAAVLARTAHTARYHNEPLTGQ
jgi:hypothetical protein